MVRAHAQSHALQLLLVLTPAAGLHCSPHFVSLLTRLVLCFVCASFRGLDQAERIRIEEEKIETHLREKLSTVNTQVNDVSDRVHQLRQLEEEFKLKGQTRTHSRSAACAEPNASLQLVWF